MRTIDWVPGQDSKSGHIQLIDQTLLPGAFSGLEIHTVEELADAIIDITADQTPVLPPNKATDHE